MLTRIATHAPITATPLADAAGLVARLGAAFGRLVRALGHRRDVRLLLDLDERALDDIGLTHNDVLGALAEPLTRNPSSVLIGSAGKRSRARPT